MEADAEMAQLEKVFSNLGADRRQARVMAEQTAKRATQLCEQRGMDRVSAVKYLLELVVSGRAGEAPPSLSGESGDEPSSPDKS